SIALRTLLKASAVWVSNFIATFANKNQDDRQSVCQEKQRGKHQRVAAGRVDHRTKAGSVNARASSGSRSCWSSVEPLMSASRAVTAYSRLSSRRISRQSRRQAAIVRSSYSASRQLHRVGGL